MNIHKPHMIYTDQRFENYKEGQKPTCFELFFDNSIYYNDTVEKHFRSTYDSMEIVRMKKDERADNLALQLNGHVDVEEQNNTYLRSCFGYLPMQKKGVISFSFMIKDYLADKRSYINTNLLTHGEVRFLINDGYFEFITVRENKVYWRGEELIRADIRLNQWYRVDLALDVEAGSAILYFDGVPTSVTLPEGTVNISEVRFDMPQVTGSAWLIDELRVYLAENLIPDEEIDADWKAYTESPFYAGAEFEACKTCNYDYLAFREAYTKVLTGIHSKRLYANNRLITMPTAVTERNGEIVVPVCSIAEALGVEAALDTKSGKLAFRHDERIIEVTSEEYFLIEGTVCMPVNTLSEYLGKDCTEKYNILWFDEPVPEKWEMPNPNTNTLGFSVEKHMHLRIQTMLLFDRPTVEDIAKAISKHSPNNKHPRLMIDSFEQIKYGIKNDPQFKAIADCIIEEAKKYVNVETVKHELKDGKRAAYTGLIKKYFQALSFAYRFSEEDDVEKYKDAIWRQMEALYEFPNFNLYRHSLCTGTICHGLYFAYDWLYDAWTPKQRAMIEEVCKRNIFDPLTFGYNSSVNRYGGSVNCNHGNQPIITSGGVAVLALAMYDVNPDYYAYIIRSALRATEYGFLDFFPEGEWKEGVSYWRYTMDFMPTIIKSLQTACGTDFGITAISGVLKTCFFPINMRGTTNAFAFGDGQPELANVGAMMFQAEQTKDKELAEFRKNNLGSGTIIDLISWVYDTEDHNVGLEKFEHDVYAKSNSTVIMKTGWGKDDTAVALHGGANNDPHGHIDCGSFQFDMNGVRFAMDLPREDYNLGDLGHYNAQRVKEFYPDGPVYTGGHYYRRKGEGHNCVVANRQEVNGRNPKDCDSYDMKRSGKTTFLKVEFGEMVSTALLDLTDVNVVFENARRGVTLDKVKNIIEIRDDIKAIKETDFLWSMHTYATIALSGDRKSAVLAQEGKSIKAQIVSDGDEVFEVLPAAFLEDYGISVKPLFESPNTIYTKEDAFYLTHGCACKIPMDARKLAVRAVTDHFRLTVTFQP